MLREVVVNHVEPAKNAVQDCPQNRLIPTPRYCDCQRTSNADAVVVNRLPHAVILVVGKEQRCKSED